MPRNLKPDELVVFGDRTVTEEISLLELGFDDIEVIAGGRTTAGMIAP